ERTDRDDNTNRVPDSEEEPVLVARWPLVGVRRKALAPELADLLGREPVHTHRTVDLDPRVGDRLSHLRGDQPGHRLAVGREAVRRTPEDAGPFVPRHACPALLVLRRAVRRGPGILDGRHGSFAQREARRRVYDRTVPTAGGRPPGPADEQGA